jgi:hypothetical protein
MRAGTIDAVFQHGFAIALLLALTAPAEEAPPRTEGTAPAAQGAQPAQGAAPAAQASKPVEASAPPAGAEAEERPWGFRLSGYGYIVPGESFYVVPIAAFDYRWLHLEARYNYEAKQAGSVWVGYNLEWGDELKFSLTPMLGGVFGKLNGLGAGVEWALAWWLLEIYSEWEMILDLGDVEQSYFYAWSELSMRPLAWLRFGLALQRTRVHDVPVEVSWGPLLGFSVWKLQVAGYYFNPGNVDTQYGVVYLGFEL